MKLVSSLVVTAAVIVPSAAFTAHSKAASASRPSTGLCAEANSRRETLGDIAKFFVGGAVAATVGGDAAFAASNPALETFKSKNKSNSFYPGKGMRAHTPFDELC